MKKCICTACSPNLDRLHQLCHDLNDEGVKPTMFGHEVMAEFDDLLLVPIIVDMFASFNQYSVYVEF